MAPKFPHLKIVLGVIIVLSFLFFSLSTLRVSDIVPVRLSKDIGTIHTTTAASSPTGSPNAKCKPTERLQPTDLDVEQIEADFPMGYENPNPWFRAPAQPIKSELEALLTPEQKALLPGFRATSQNWPEKRRKIESFYGINRTGSWQDHIQSLNDDDLAPLTKWVQQYIYDYQHPLNCSDKKFYVLKNKWPRHGLGAIIRRVFVELSLAMQADRILILDNSDAPGNTLVESDCANHQGKNASLECVLEDLSSCASFVTKENSVDSIDLSEVHDGVIRDTPPFPAAAYLSYLGGSGTAPSGSVLRYWWRAQLYGYILRPNRLALERMAELRLNDTLHKGYQTNRSDISKPSERHVPFPLPPSTLSVHIRHGDKAGEGRLITTRDYIVTAERFLLRNPLAYQKRAFMSTEDPNAIKEAINTPFINPVRSHPNLDWLWYYSGIPRVDGGPQKNLALTHNKTDALLTHMMQLWMAVECDTFVGNRNSNWNKMIDAIRCTLMDKCRAPYLDAGFVADWVNFP